MNFKCNKCGYCCSYIVRITDEEKNRISSAGYSSNDFFNSSLSSLNIVNGKCFFHKDKLCTIYDIRPRVCREFPLKNGKKNHRCRQFIKEAPFMLRALDCFHTFTQNEKF